MAAITDAIDDVEQRFGRPFVVYFPEPPPEHGQRLLEALGAKWEVRSMSSRLPVAKEEQEARDAQVVTTRCADCEWSVITTAVEARERYREHREKWHAILDRNGRGTLDRMDAGEPQQPGATRSDLETPPPVLSADAFACKVDGCVRRAKSNRGPYAYLCEQHTSERRRLRGGQPKVPEPAAKPKPEPQPVAAKPPTLDALVENVRQAQAAVDEARRTRDAALEAFEAEVERLREELAA